MSRNKEAIAKMDRRWRLIVYSRACMARLVKRICDNGYQATTLQNPGNFAAGQSPGIRGPGAPLGRDGCAWPVGDFNIVGSRRAGDLLTLKEAADALDVSEGYLRNLKLEGVIRAEVYGNRLFFNSIPDAK